MNRLIIQGGTVITETGELRADVTVQGERIAALSQETAPGPDDTVIDAAGCYVLPGIIDAHTHIKLDTGIYQTDDDWFTGTRAAALGGVTTVIDFATQQRGQSFAEAMGARRAEIEAEGAAIDYALHCMVTDLPPGTEDRLGELVALGAAGTKVYTTYRPNYYMDDAHILRILHASAEAGGLVIVHCENDALVTAATEALVARGDTGWRHHAQGRPALAEVEAVARVLLLADAAEAPVYIVHCSTARAIEMVQQAREWGQEVYCETCPQYMLLDESAYAGPHPEHYILQPPLRDAGEPPRIRELVAAGAVDAIATDHCDYALAQKQAVDDFTKTPGGLPGVETLLPLVYTHGKLTMPQLVGLLSANPARIFGLYPQKGAVQPGADADLVVYDPAPAGRVAAATLHYISTYTSYEGMSISGAVRATVSRGEVVVERGVFHGEPGRGRFAACHRVRTEQMG